MLSKNWFEQGGQAYARFRPEYPAELAIYLASLAPDRDLAVDVGCGNGQLTRLLAGHFDAVVGVDPSADQHAHAALHATITYQRAPAEDLPLPARSASLVTAAQAAHWFDLPAFYDQVRRIARPGAVVALVSYGVLRLAGDPGARFARFYEREIGPFWPPERRLVDSGYATLDFPFAPIDAPAMAIQRAWTLAELLGYVSTWSAVRRAREDGREGVLHRFAGDIADCWGDPATPRAMSWPIAMRIGRAA